VGNEGKIFQLLRPGKVEARGVRVAKIIHMKDLRRKIFVLDKRL
jgi:hypothetical protein